jgi:hypothetical protein
MYEDCSSADVSRLVHESFMIAVERNAHEAECASPIVGGTRAKVNRNRVSEIRKTLRRITSSAPERKSVVLRVIEA